MFMKDRKRWVCFVFCLQLASHKICFLTDNGPILVTQWLLRSSALSPTSILNHFISSVFTVTSSLIEIRELPDENTKGEGKQKEKIKTFTTSLWASYSRTTGSGEALCKRANWRVCPSLWRLASALREPMGVPFPGKASLCSQHSLAACRPHGPHVCCCQSCWWDFMGAASDSAKRHSLTADSPILWPFQFFGYLFSNVPWALGLGVALYMYQGVFMYLGIYL